MLKQQDVTGTIQMKITHFSRENLHTATLLLAVGSTSLAWNHAAAAQDLDTLGLEEALVDARYQHDGNPIIPRPQKAEEASPDIDETPKPFLEWSHLTGDWNGLRPRLEELGIALEADLTFDHSHNLDGGINRGSATRHLFNFNLTLDTQRLGLWDNATFFLNFQQIDGPGIGDEVGDVQGLDNMDADGRAQLSEIWYEHLFAEETLRIRLGKIDANSEFAFADRAGEFLNSSMGFSPTIFVFPSYPDPAFGFTLFTYPTESLYAGIGVFDGSGQEGITTGSRGPSTVFGGPGDLFYIAEVGVMWSNDDQTLEGRLGGGVWFHDGDFTTFAATTDDHATGFYLVFDQMLWRENPGDDDDAQGLACFFQYGYADEQVSSVAHHFGGGVTWTGLIPDRNEDVLGLGVSAAILSDEAGAGFTDTAETAVELFYRIQLTPYLSVKPDLQYIANPGGAGADDALAATVRVELSF